MKRKGMFVIVSVMQTDFSKARYKQKVKRF